MCQLSVFACHDTRFLDKNTRFLPLAIAKKRGPPLHVKERSGFVFQGVTFDGLLSTTR